MRPSSSSNEQLARILAAVGMGATWAVGWGFVGALVGLLIGILTPDGIEGTRIAGAIRAFVQAGFVCGGAFSVVLAIAGRRRTFDEMSLPRFAALGALGSLLGYVAFAASLGGGGAIFRPLGLVVASVMALLGAGSAAGSLALARRADDRELLDAGPDIDGIGLTK